MPGARRFCSVRELSWKLVLQAADPTGKEPRMNFHEVVAGVAGNVREGDELSAALLLVLVILDTVRHDLAHRLYVALKRQELRGLGLGS